jgi:hypothetical protein
MRHRRWIDLVLRILPFDGWKDALIRGHVERCPECSRQLITAEEARRAIAGADHAGRVDVVTRKVMAEIEACAPLAAPVRAATSLASVWRWAAATAGLAAAVVLIAALVLFFRGAPGAGSLDGAAVLEFEEFQINYVKIGDEPAQTFVFKPRDSDVIIVWAGKTH